MAKKTTTSSKTEDDGASDAASDARPDGDDALANSQPSALETVASDAPSEPGENAEMSAPEFDAAEPVANAESETDLAYPAEDEPAPAPLYAHPVIAPDSPISNDSLEVVAALVSRRFKAVRKRVPKDVRQRALGLLADLYTMVHTAPGAERWPVARRKRLEMARDLENLAAELLGTTAFAPDFYADGRLAIIRAFDPIRIEGSIQPAKVEAHFIRYEERARRALARLDWFLKRCGVEPDEPDADDIPPWQRPYGRLDAYKELLWGTPRRKVPQPR